MKLARRRKGSNREKKMLDIKFQPNCVGLGGYTALIFETETEYFTLRFESEAEIKELLSQAHIVWYNYGEMNS